ncbi:MAG: outer membrane protein assembly factor BamD [Gammaproteobacteria bacterium]|nr:outer membrane protein assembly factor BamD [Gammaproteobacteria bacterium]
MFGEAPNHRCAARHHGVIVIALVAALSGCAGLGERDDLDEYGDSAEASQQALYDEAQQALRSGNYTESIVRLQRLDARFPFGRYAEQSQLELIFAHHMIGDHDAALAAADRFIRLHPQHPNVDYAHYMRGLSSLAQDRGIFRRFLGTDISRRDITNIKQAFVYFNDLVTSFPGSIYAMDSRQRMIYIRNVLAAHELNVATYYLGRGAFVAAANRARYVIENFSQTNAVPDALAVLVEANWQLGLDDSAHDALAVLALNFPDYYAFDGQGQLVLRKVIDNRQRNWLNMVTFGLLGRPEAPPPLTIRRSGTVAKNPS